MEYSNTSIQCINKRSTMLSILKEKVIMHLTRKKNIYGASTVPLDLRNVSVVQFVVMTGLYTTAGGDCSNMTIIM